MIHKLKSYFKFLLKSTNHHGVHSPFVFDFVTKCLYVKKRKHQQKTIDVLLKSIAYFDFKTVHVPNNALLKQSIEATFPKIIFNSKKIDLLYTTELDTKSFRQLLSKEILHNNSMILIDGIHSNPEKAKLWEDLVQLPEITVSMDMYYCGALFIRKEQVKEHFTIRI